MNFSIVTPLLLWGGLFSSAIALGLLSPLERFPWLACVLFAPLAYKLRHENGILKGMLIGWTFGTLSWAAGTWWVLTGMNTLLAWPSGCSLIAAVLTWLYQGAPFALVGGACGWMNQRKNPPGPLFCASLLTLMVFIRPPLIPVSSAVAVALWPSFIQVADLGGEYFVFFILILVNWMIADCFAGFRRPEPSCLWIRIALLFSVLGIVLGYGKFQTEQFQNAVQRPGKQLVVASVQPDVPVQWDKNALEDFVTAEALCQRTLETYSGNIQDAGLIIFPEMPGFDCQSDRFRESGLEATLQGLGILPILTGDEYILAPEAPAIKTTGERMAVKQRIKQKFSSVFTLSPNGNCSLVYRKMKLVSFSETTPMGNWFPWLKTILGPSLEVSPGKGPSLIEIGSFFVQPLICFETGFSGLARQGVSLGTDLLVEVSNDGWFSSREAEIKHLGMGIFRSVEIRRPLVRSSNSGSGAHVTAAGQIVPGTLTPHGTACVTRAQMHSPDTVTLFTRWGNAWLWAGVVIVLWRIKAALGIRTLRQKDNKVGSF